MSVSSITPSATAPTSQYRDAGAPAAPTATSAEASDRSPAVVIDPKLVMRLAAPTRDGVATLATDLSTRLAERFAAAGLPTDPPVTFTVDASGRIRASGARDDLAAVDDMVASDALLGRVIRMTNGIAAQAHALEQTRPEDSYRNAADPRSAIALYQQMMATHRSTMSFRFDGTGVTVAADGVDWVPGAAAEQPSGTAG